MKTSQYESLHILIIGITGTQGRAVARHLLAAGHQVRGLTRRPGSPAARALATAGALLVEGDLNDPVTVEDAMRDVDGVYLVTEFFRNGIDAEIRHGKQVADAVHKLGIRHLVYASVAGADRSSGVPHFESKAEIERHIRALDIPATFLRPAMFMEDLTDKQYFPPASWGMMPKLVGRDRPVKWTSVEDIAATATVVFQRRDDFVGAVVPVVGDEKSMEEARRIFVRVRGKRPFALAIPTFLFRLLVGDELLVMWRWLASHSMDGDPAATRRLIPGAKDLETWLRSRSATAG